MCGDSSVVEKWINGYYAVGQTFRERIGCVQRTLHSWWKGETADAGDKIGDFVKHIFREHNQEADHLASLGADGMRRITVEKGATNETWKAVH